MNSFTGSPDFAVSIANQTIAEHIRDAQHRAAVRTARAERRRARRTALAARQPTGSASLPWWSLRFLQPHRGH
jgi:hypothetical protein